MHLHEMTSAITALIESGKGEVVSSEEAMRRYEICKNCPVRQPVRFTSTVGQVLALRLSKHRVPDEFKGKKCGICGCPWALLIPSRGEVLHTDDEKQAAERAKKAPNCWLPEAKRQAATS